MNRTASKTKPLVVALAAAGLLTACATPGAGGSHGAAKGASKTTPKTTPKTTKAAFGGRETLAKAGLAHPETVWVPARYTAGGHDALFIHGRRFVAPGGHGNVPGFIKTGHGYLVAVREPATRSDGVQVAPRVVFYRVGSSGRVVGKAASLTDHHSRVVVARHAIYLQQPAGTAADGALRLYSYVGVDGKGHQVAGPQNVLFATPAPDGGWYVERLLRAQAPAQAGNGYFYEIVQRGAQGKQHVVTRANNTYTVNRFVHSRAAFVDRPPLADSVRTGFSMRVYQRSHRPYNHGYDWSGSAYRFAVKPGKHCWGLIGRKCAPLLGAYTSQYGSAVNGMGTRAATDLARRSVLYGTVAHPRLATQFSGAGLGSALDYGVVNLKNKHKTVLFELEGGGLNTFRQFIGHNTGQASVNSRNDVFAMLTPHGPVFAVANNADNPQGTMPAYDPDHRKTVGADDIDSFLARYGFVGQ